jgi:hypothetical protein
VPNRYSKEDDRDAVFFSGELGQLQWALLLLSPSPPFSLLLLGLVCFVGCHRVAARVCRCLTTNSLPRGYPGQLFGIRCVLELDDERRDS